MAGQPVQAASPGAGSGAENGDDTLPSRVSAALELASASLTASAEPPALLRNHSPALEFLKDEAGRLVYYNRAFANVFAAEGGSLLRKRDHEWLPPAAAECVRRHDEMVLATGAVLEIEETLPTPAGPRHWLVVRFPLQAESGVRLVGAVAVDISDRRRRESTLHRMAAILESSHDAVISASPDGLVTSWNMGATQMYGYSAAEMEGQPVSILEPEERAGEIDQVLERIRAGERVVRYETIRLHKSGRALEVAVAVSPILDETGAVAGTASISRDIGDTKRAQEIIVFQSFHDSLTGLSNRALLMERLTLCLEKARHGAKRLAVLFLDLDLFRAINDSFGHDVGDNIFREVSRRLLQCVRDGDTVARVGGDEFIVLLPDLARSEDATTVARKLLEAVAQPFEIEGRRVDLTTSIGVAIYPDDGQDPEALLRNADAAMTRAKERGRNNFQLSVPELTEEALRRLSLQAGLRQAIENNELVLHYQPVLSLATGRIVELEALVRWQHPQNGLIMPNDFIHVAEKAGMMVSLGEWVLAKAAQQTRLWQIAGFAGLRIAINLSPSQFHEKNLVSNVRRVLTETGLPAEALEIEITEGVAMEDAEVTVANLLALRDLNVGVSIDDFGTGYSSLSYLKRLPIDTIKLDQSFVRDVTSDPDDAAIASAVIAMAHSLELSVVAEGVETEEQLAFLRSQGCDRMQGHLLAPALPAEAFERFLLAGTKLEARSTVRQA